ncbi:DUF202 domain-containing protein [Streptomyces sp. NPDC007088]|uniref:DUF202 domain-containing protein n=1 Tax=Streptomyces sp. NPDC007088 TaxID=3364773 RepID=UPI00369D5D28
MSGPAGARDPGLQPERTRLAWRRTSLSCAVAAVLALKSALAGGGAYAAGGCALAWLGFLALARYRSRVLAARRPPALTVWSAAVCVGCVLAMALCAAAVIL